MKKIFSLIFVALFCAAGIFADKNSFYKDGRIVDVLYVDASSGLRVRNDSSLDAKKIGYVYPRMAVKPVAIGPEVTIDGIKSNWVKILLPLETIKKGYSVFGWVFGGYLTEKLKPFSTKGWTDEDLYLYLGRFAWISGTRSYYEYTKDGKFCMGLMESGHGGEGTYYVSMKDNRITERAVWGDEDEVSEPNTASYNIEYIKETEFAVKGLNKYRPAMFAHDYFFSDYIKERPSIDTFDETAVNAFFFEWSAEEIRKLDEAYQLNETFYINMIKMGVVLPWKSGYMDVYHEYWDNQIRWAER